MIVSQTDFRSALLNPDADRPAGVVDPKGRPATKRFDVYRNNVAVSLTEALETAFPVVRRLVGEQNFRTLAGVFLRQHPPGSPLMMFYGAEMPAFLGQFPPTQSIGYLPDVARLELAIRESYHAANADPVDPQALQSLSPDVLMQSSVGLAPSLRLVRSDWPVFSIWQFNMTEGAPKPVMVAQDVLVLRPEMDPAPHLLTPGTGTFIAGLLAGKTLGQSLDDATTAAADFDLSAALTLLIGAGAITSIGG